MSEDRLPAPEMIDDEDVSVPVLFDIDLTGSTAADAFFRHVTVESDPDLYRSGESMRERLAEHYGVPIDQVCARAHGDTRSRSELQGEVELLEQEVLALGSDVQMLEAERDRLRAIVIEHAQHVSWRCEHPDRFPQVTDCRCGLLGDLAAAGIRQTSLVTVPDTVQPGAG